MRVLIVYNQPVLAETHAEADSEHQIVEPSLPSARFSSSGNPAVGRLGRNLQSLSPKCPASDPRGIQSV
jgi:hypothetical protein